MSTPKNASPAFAYICVVVALCFNIALLAHAYRNTDFSGDDIISLELAHSLSLPDFLLTPINEHFVPLHRLVTYLADAAMPMSFAFVLTIMEAFLLLGVIYLARTLAFIESDSMPDASAHPLGPASGVPGQWMVPQTRAAWLILGLYSVNAYICALFGWWTAGLHRLPMIAFSIMSIYYYLIYRRSQLARHAFASSLCLLLGLGFFLKAIFLPFYFVAIELCLRKETPTANRRRNLMFASAWISASILYVLVWRRFQPSQVREVNWDLGVQLDFLRVTAFTLRDGTTGSFYGVELFHLGHQYLADRIFSSIFWLALIGCTVALRPRNAYLWSVLFAVVVLNMLVISMSKFRTGSFGVLAAIVNHRYYFEYYFLIAIFVAIIWQQTKPKLKWSLPERAMTGACTLLLVAVAARGYISAGELVRHGKAHDFIRQVLADSKRIQRGASGPIRIVDSQVPSYVIAWQASRVLPIFGIDVEVSAPGPGVYKVLESGNLVPSAQ